MAIVDMDSDLFKRVRKHVPLGEVHAGLTRIWIYGATEVTYKLLAALAEEFGTDEIDVERDACSNYVIEIRGWTVPGPTYQVANINGKFSVFVDGIEVFQAAIALLRSWQGGWPNIPEFVDSARKLLAHIDGDSK